MSHSDYDDQGNLIWDSKTLGLGDVSKANEVVQAWIDKVDAFIQALNATDGAKVVVSYRNGDPFDSSKYYTKETIDALLRGYAPAGAAGDGAGTAIGWVRNALPYDGGETFKQVFDRFLGTELPTDSNYSQLKNNVDSLLGLGTDVDTLNHWMGSEGAHTSLVGLDSAFPSQYKTGTIADTFNYMIGLVTTLSSRVSSLESTLNSNTNP